MTRFDVSQPPFDVLTVAEAESLVARGDLLFFSDDEDILLPGDPVDSFYLIVKGVVRELVGEETIGAYRERDTFDSRALVAGKTTHLFVAHEETLLLALPREAVMTLTENNPAFGAHFFARVSEKLGGVARQKGRSELQSLMTATLDELGVQSPVFVAGETSITEVARLMKERKTKSVLVRDGAQVGIFTASDFRDVVIDAVAGETPVKQRARFSLFCCEKSDYLFSALLLMTRQNIQRVVVTEAGQPIGVLEQIDLLSHFSSHSHIITQQIGQAEDIPALKEAATAIDAMIAALTMHGMKAPQLARLVQALNAQLMAKLWQVVAPPAVFAGSSLLVMGSEGRGEQILKSDQDNALIAVPDLDEAVVAQAAQAFSAALIDFGYPPCAGGVMVSNPAWRKTREAWRETLFRWVHQPQPEAWLNLAVFLDAEAVSGDRQWLAECKAAVRQWARDDMGWLGRMAWPVEQFDHSDSFFQQLLNPDKGTRLDVKKNGIFPVVHGTRVLALEAGLEVNNTFERLQALAARGVLEHELADDVSEALAFLMKIRLDAGLLLRHLHGGGDSAATNVADNTVDTMRLSTLERDLLKEALAVVKRFKAMLNQHYRLDRF